MKFDFQLSSDENCPSPMGLIVLQVDETIEGEFREAFRKSKNQIFVTRIPSGLEVTAQTLTSMEQHITTSAKLLPQSREFSVIGYGCTSASAIIGSEKISELIKSGCHTRKVTNPLLSATEYAKNIGVTKLALLSPYIEEVNTPLRKAFETNGLSTEAFGTFGEGKEEKVARISERSTIEAAINLGQKESVEAVFISCTNLRTFNCLDKIANEINKPVFSSNQSLAWHMKKLSEQNL
ncbi:Asp/Glu racemase [Paracoccaceae bacterium]|nr:Asp/Glu racemase [Paracoccaceae bacterium]